MSRQITLFSLIVISWAAGAVDLPPLDATVTYESKSVTYAGVTEVRQFRNLLIRRPGHVWMERILPATNESFTQHETSEKKSGHKHFDFDTSIQHLSRTDSGEVRADYVDRQNRQIVFVPPTEYSVSGFDGSWDNAATMVSEKMVRAMPLSNRATPMANSEWHEEVSKGWYNRVLWSNQYKVALVIESGKTNGTAQRKTILAIRAATPDNALPWKQLSGYVQKEYDDFMD
jgi:hypothetical protein